MPTPPAQAPALPLVYRTDDGATEIDLLTDKETVWLTQAQMAELFERDRNTVGEHIGNVYAEGELGEDPTVRNFRVVRLEGAREVGRNVQHYNLDVVISVGYRVKSKRGTQFRQWATRTLRRYLEDGYVVNRRRVADLDAVNTILKRALTARMEAPVQADFLALLEQYEHGLTLLDRYDHGSLDAEADALVNAANQETYRLTYADARAQVDKWKQSRYGEDRAPLEGTPAYKLDLFGVEKDGSFQASIDGIYASWGGQEVYPTLEEKAANLLYFLVKNHGFSDGNKRIAAGLFIYYLDRNQALYRPDGTKRLADNALVALTLFIAMSPPDQQAAVVVVAGPVRVSADHRPRKARRLAHQRIVRLVAYGK